MAFSYGINMFQISSLVQKISEIQFQKLQKFQFQKLSEQ